MKRNVDENDISAVDVDLVKISAEEDKEKREDEVESQTVLGRCWIHVEDAVQHFVVFLVEVRRRTRASWWLWGRLFT